MQQVMYANGKLWDALDSALNPDGGPQRAAIAWYVINPDGCGTDQLATEGKGCPAHQHERRKQ